MRRRHDPRSWFAPHLLRVYLTEYIVARTPRQRCVAAVDLSKVWVEEYFDKYRDEVAQVVAGFDERTDLEEIPLLLPGFVTFAREKDPELFERPAGMY